MDKENQIPDHPPVQVHGRLKSTYMRRVALIIPDGADRIHALSPAKKCEMPIFDKIFTRIGASDDITLSSQSTFMVEMTGSQQRSVPGDGGIP